MSSIYNKSGERTSTPKDQTSVILQSDLDSFGMPNFLPFMMLPREIGEAEGIVDPVKPLKHGPHHSDSDPSNCKSSRPLDGSLAKPSIDGVFPRT